MKNNLTWELTLNSNQEAILTFMYPEKTKHGLKYMSLPVFTGDDNVLDMKFFELSKIDEMLSVLMIEEGQSISVKYKPFMSQLKNKTNEKNQNA